MPQITSTDEYQDLFDIDANINRLVRNIELLNYINPLNIEREKRQFFSSKFKYEPDFHYTKLKFTGSNDTENNAHILYDVLNETPTRPTNTSQTCN